MVILENPQEGPRDAIRRLMIVVNRIDGLYYLAARRLGVKINTFTLLYALDDGQPHSQKQICDEWCIPKTTINTVVRECVQAGYVTLLDEPHSKEKTVSITPAGQQYAQALLQTVYGAEARAMEATLAHFSPVFVEAAERFACCLQDEFEKEIKDTTHKT